MAAKGDEARGGANGRMLVIDDDHTILDLFSQVLVREGYEVETADSAEKGLELFETGAYDVVLTDLVLAERSGIDVLRRIKETDPRASVVIMTGFASTESAVEALRLGANDYLPKPVRALELVKSVRSQMAAIELSDRIEELNRQVAAERDKLRRSVAELTLLKGLAEQMLSVLSYLGGYEAILNLLTDEVAADVALIYDLERRSARIRSKAKPEPQELEQLAEAIRSRGSEMLRTQIDCRPENFIGIDHAAPSASTGGLKSIAVVPLLQEQRPIGLLVAASRDDERFAEKWLDFMSRISSSASEFLHRIKRSVERQRHFTASVVEHTIDGIVVISPSSGEVLLNPAARTLLDIPSGQTPTAEQIGDYLGLDFQSIWGELQPPETEEPPRGTKTLRLELLRQGRKLFFQLNVSLLPAEFSEPGMLLVVIHDVTRERAVEEMKNRLISNITHEVRTPTAVVKEFMSLIMDGVSGELGETQRQYMQVMHANIERLSRLIENLLALARSDTGGFAVVLKPTSLQQIVDQVVESMEVKLRRKSIHLVQRLPAGLPLIYADPDAVTQILTNLIDNAYKYSPEDTEVEVSAEALGNRIQIEVKDQGYGIPHEDQEKIFQRFQRLVDENDPRFQEGVGLGLSLVKDLVTRHGGEIWVESSPGKGSTFHFTLQVAAEDEELRPA